MSSAKRFQLQPKRRGYFFIFIFLGIVFQTGCVRWVNLFSQDNFYYLPPHEKPFYLELKTPRGELLYCGIFHTNSPDDPQIGQIIKYWEEFQPTLAFCEGKKWPPAATLQESIRRYGEQGLISFLAAQDGIKLKCLDLSLTRQAVFLSHYFFPGHIKIYYVLREVVTRRRVGLQEEEGIFYEKLLTELSRIKGFDVYPLNLIELEKMLGFIFPELENWRCIPSFYFYNSQKGKFLVQIHRYLQKFRNRHMAQALLAGLKRRERVFAVCGRSHVVSQIPLLLANMKEGKWRVK